MKKTLSFIASLLVLCSAVFAQQVQQVGPVDLGSAVMVDSISTTSIKINHGGSGSFAIGVSTLNLNAVAVTGTLVTGDTIVVAGNAQVYTVTNVTTASSNAFTGVTITPALVAAAADAAAVTVTKNAGWGTALDSNLPLPDRIVLTAVVTGSPTTCTFNIYGVLKAIGDPSLVKADFEKLVASATACDVTAAPNGRITIFVNDKLLRTIIPKVESLDGGTTPSVKFVLMYRGSRA